ncbi:uncharacterized protein LACBIDRAFT_328338 [Laccaria bicolor S238N-H82]|uniref:Predicted protein n=1 Tax=Laccaria bicolor (strain S238N-H82 / ATCC MYA-4686) TaxID=486041 RepID=B0DEK6_LACBS|nr:uncharacterized protein LACBIDRAFT_328338 [Laccaria bicolor S238N-H82]EDR07051.1 predicted protein [Laccaria bicolor S238N-H82]|eukprot:XP_001882424.1 predicted protein [Laccaria bicolor S238N-H82]
MYEGRNVEAIVDVWCDAPVQKSWKTFADSALTPEDRQSRWGGIEYWFALGVHPHDAKHYTDAVEKDILEAMTHPRCVALGEIGLDYHYDNSPRDVQRNVFRRQLKHAVRLGKPLVIHTREAEEDTEKILKEVPKDYKIHVHCFSDSPEFAARLLAHFPNLYIGITDREKTKFKRVTWIINFRDEHDGIANQRPYILYQRKNAIDSRNTKRKGEKKTLTSSDSAQAYTIHSLPPSSSIRRTQGTTRMRHPTQTMTPKGGGELPDFTIIPPGPTSPAPFAVDEVGGGAELEEGGRDLDREREAGERVGGVERLWWWIRGGSGRELRGGEGGRSAS